MHRNQEKLGPIGCPTHSWCYAWDIQLSVIFPSGSPNKSVATSIAPVTAPQGPQEAHSLRLLVPGAVRWGCGWHIPTNTKIFILESQQIHWYLICPCKCSPRPPGGTWPTPFGPWCWCCGWHTPNNKKSFSRGTHKSPDTPFCHVSAPQGFEEAHGLHLLVPGAGAVGGTSPPIKILYLGVLMNLLIPHLPL